VIALCFQPERLPRSMKREEWREVWRWKRTTEKKINEMAQAEQRALSDMVAFGQGTMLIESLTRPPVMFYPEVEPVDVDIRPGAIWYL
jgi:hypothetical protein